MRSDDETYIRQAVLEVISSSYFNYLGGQFWVGGWAYWGNAYTSFFRDVLGLELPGDLWARSRAYDAIAESTCWWYPHRDFVMACERPLVINRELVGDVHQLHCDDGPSLVWPDGWGVWSHRGVRVTQQVIEAPETLTVEQIRNENNAEVRRVMLQRFGTEKYIRESGAQLIHKDEWGELYETEIPGDEPLVMVKVVNSTAEPDGSFKDYWLRVDPRCRPFRRLPDGSSEFRSPQHRTALNAVASTFGLTGPEYKRALVAQS